MSASSLARRFAYASGISSARVSGALLATLFFFLLPVAANAYTLVLRSGRHVTVPDDFKVTPSAVIYEATPGFSVTVWLTNVDVAATERANAEPAGSFAKRIKQEPGGRAAARAQGAVKAERRAGPKVVTNRDLEPSRLRREAQEEEYERTRRERGMPSKQELQRRTEEQDRRLHESALQIQAEQAELESVRSELVNVRRDLNELGSRPSQQTGAYVPAYAYPNYYPYYYSNYYPNYYAPPAVIITRFPFGRRGGFGRGNFGPYPQGPAWPYGPWQAPTFSPFGGRLLNGSTPPQVLAPAMPASRR